MKRLVYGLLLSSALTACGTSPTQDWTPMRKDTAVVWADDDSELALTVSTYEEKGGGMFSKPERRNFNHQLVVQQGTNNEARLAITEARELEAGTLYYMKSAGYFVVESIADDGMQQFSRILPNGHEILIIEGRPISCEEGQTGVTIPHSVIPSPNGQQLAHIYTPSCGELGVEFMQAADLSFLDGKFMEITQAVTATWHPQGYLIVSTLDGANAWRIAPHEEFQPTMAPNCLTPTTSSSAISSTGVKINIENDSLVEQDLGIDHAFGCQ